VGGSLPAREMVSRASRHVGSGDVSHQPIESVLPKEAARQRADRSYDEQIVVACGEKPAYGYRRVTWWLRRKENLLVNRKTRIASDARTWVAGTLAPSSCTTEERVGPRGCIGAKSGLAVGHDQDLGGPAVGWAYLVCVIDCCTREIVGWNLSHRCRTEDALAAVEQAVLARLPSGSREANVTLTTDNGTQFTLLDSSRP